jgi:hypothetical protein
VIRRTAPLLGALLLAVVVLGPALGPGYVLQYDMVFVPRQWLLPASFGLGGQLPRAVPQDAVLGVLTAVLPGSVWQHLALLAIVVLGALGAARLLREQPLVVRLAAALLLVWSPYVAQRLLLGSWSLLLAVALLPWALQAAVDVRSGRPHARWRLLLLVGLASITPTGGLLVVLVVGPVAVGPRSRAALRERVLLAAALVVLQLPWVVPSLLHPASAASDPAGAGVFALRSEGGWGPLLTALGTGGIWNGEVVLPSRALALAPVAAVLLAVLALLGLRPLSRVLGRAAVGWLAACAVAGLLVAVLGAWSPTRGLVEQVVSAVPGGGLLRDGQKWLAPWTLLLALAAPLGLRSALSRVQDATVAAALGVALVLLPVAVMPDLVWGGLGRMRTTDYPEGWTRTRDLLESPAAEAGDVVVLPWSAFRAFTWNRRTTSLDPAPRFLPRTTVVDDSLLVAGADGLVRVSGEDPRSEVVATALRAGRPLAEVLPGLGVRYVVVEGGTPGEVPATALAGLERLDDDSSLALWKVVGGIAPPPVPSTTSVVLVAASYLLAGLVLVTAGLGSAASSRGRRRKPQPPATVR